MKKIIALFVAMILVLAFSACNKAESPTPDSSDKTQETTQAQEGSSDTTQSPESPATSNPDLKISEDLKQMIAQPTQAVSESETFEEGKVKISYPVFTDEKYSAVNLKLKEFAMKVVEKNKNTDTELELEVDGVVSFVNDEVVSVIFEGYGNFEGAAHPWNIFEAINLKVETAETVKFSDYVEVNEVLIDTLLESPKEGYTQEIVDGSFEIMSASKQDIYDRLSDIDSGNQWSSFYFRQGVLGVSLPIAHYLGDHIEYEISI